MNDCPNGELRDRLPDLLHDRLPPPQRRELEAHLATCADCRAELALLRAARASMRRPAVDVSRIVAALPAPPAARRSPRRSWVGWRAAAAITLLAAGGTSVVVVQRGSTRHAPSSIDTSGLAVRNGTARVVDSTFPAATATPDAGSSASAHAQELAVGGGAITDLSDRELTALLRDMESLDAVPSADVDNAALVSSVSPTGEVQE